MATMIPSPLDDALRELLREVHSLDGGYQPGAQTREIASSLAVPEQFVDALFTSARARGLLKPQPFGRSRYRWTVSARGTQFIGE